MKRIALIAAIVAVPFAAKAEDIMTCKNPEGHRYAVNDGWVEDGISNSTTTLTYDGQNYDLVIDNPYRGKFTATGDGAKVLVVEANATSVILLVAYPHAAETYVFDTESQKMLFNTAKITNGSTAAVFVADCGNGWF